MLNLDKPLLKPFFAFSTIIIILIILSQTSYVKETDTLPDSSLYPLDVSIDNLDLALTFNTYEKASKSLGIVEERISESKKMISKNNMKAAKIANLESKTLIGAAEKYIITLDESLAKSLKDQLETYKKESESIDKKLINS